jgi:DeoR family transcriptional regulator of aga operon
VIADINRSMVERCEEVIVLVDPSTGGVTAHYRVAGVDIVDEFVTSNDGRETLQRQLGAAATILTPHV